MRSGAKEMKVSRDHHLVDTSMEFVRTITIISVDTDPNLKKVDQITIAGQQADIYQYSWMTGMSTTTILRDTFEPISSVIQQTFGSCKLSLTDSHANRRGCTRATS